MSEPFAIVTKDRQVVGGSILAEYAVKEESKQIKDPFTTCFGGKASKYGQSGLMMPLYKLETLATLMEQNVFHARCVQTKARDTVGNGWVLTPRETLQGTASSTQHDTLFEWLYDMWPPMTGELYKVMVDYDSLGNGYLECAREYGRNDSPIVNLYHVPGHTVRIHRDRTRYCQIRGGKRVWFKAVGHEKDVDITKGVEAELGTLEPEARAAELIHLSSYTPRSEYYGLPDVIPAVGAIVGSVAARDYNIKFFTNFGIPAYAVYVTGDYNLGEPDENGEYQIIKDIRKYFHELQGEPHSTLVFGIPSAKGGVGQSNVQVEIKPLAIEVKDASFRLYRKDARDEIIAAHGVPGYRIAINETSSLGSSTAQEATKIYVESVINPRQEMVEDTLNHWVLPTLVGNTDWRFQLKDLSTEAEDHDQNVADFLCRNGAMRPNDLIRYFGKRFGLEPDEGNPALNSYYVNGQPVDLEPPAIKAVKSMQGRLLELVAGDGTEASRS